ncbi:VOC family protein [Streptomyces sp. NPDC005476]|uniref:VOC family protein n=1 Tax=Streptomyces sp. NPDC005476 TaxID=3156882 RepID=UPI003454F609
MACCAITTVGPCTDPACTRSSWTPPSRKLRQQPGSGRPLWGCRPVPTRQSPSSRHWSVRWTGWRPWFSQLDDTPRIHIDIETDDVDAEVDRLVRLGATEVSRWLQCHVLRAPGGHLVCVIPVHSDPDLFAATARTWN